MTNIMINVLGEKASSIFFYIWESDSVCLWNIIKRGTTEKSSQIDNEEQTVRLF